MNSELLKQRIKSRVFFMRYNDGNLWYKTENDHFEFPVPTTDAGNAVFLAVDKGILFMRYIRKHMELLEESWNHAKTSYTSPAE